MSVQIIPSLLVDSREEFLQQIRASQEYIDMIQLDIADGNFVPNETWADPNVVKENVDIDIELHLMVEDPLKEIERWVPVPQVKRVLFHYESDVNIKEMIIELHKHSWHAGLVLNPDTEIEVVDEFEDDLEDVMFMGVEPGFQGQDLIPEVLDKIDEFTDKYPECFTQIDGSVNKKTIKDIVNTGVNAVCPGSAIFGNKKKPKENIEEMYDLIQELEQ
ncbi:MAG: ribulose-phosphate 3-epimerase [Candidatus Paceibacteria bacterium]